MPAVRRLPLARAHPGALIPFVVGDLVWMLPLRPGRLPAHFLVGWTISFIGICTALALTVLFAAQKTIWIACLAVFAYAVMPANWWRELRR